MKRTVNNPLVTTIRERCRVCYTCVRECPAKAIRIADGQAEVLGERCIGCGNCVRVCSQHAKQVMSGVEQVSALLASGKKVAACLAPSFPAEFGSTDYTIVVGMLRAMGFAYVNEVAFGADLVADRYSKLLSTNPGKRFIATTCPAIVGYVEKYAPDLVANLAPLVSPMVATARALRKLYGPEIKVVFIGPCIAKKGEAGSRQLSGEVDASLTFTELRGMLTQAGIAPEKVQPGEFDQPHGGMGALFPVSRGLLQAAGLQENLLDGRIVVAEGRSHFVDALKEFETGDLDAGILEVLCCNGCVMGAGLSGDSPLFMRRSAVSRYVRRRQQMVNLNQWWENMARFDGLDLTRRFAPDDQRIPVPFTNELDLIMARMGKLHLEDELNCGACGYDTCREHAIAIFKGLAENTMCLPFTIEQLRKTVKELAVSNEQLASTQAALMQSEKLASMGQLAAGIAHEVNNPLGVVLMYAHLLLDECPPEDRLREDLSMIADQADRCKKIVSGLLHFARQNKLVLQPVNLVELIAYSMRAMHLPDNIHLELLADEQDTAAEIDRDQIVQVLTNLVSNAQAAMPEGGRLVVKAGGDEQNVFLSVSDTGWGITPENMEKIFEPFFTTKQVGKGTGLGLAVTYGIVKMHRGDIRVTSNADPSAGATGTTFTVTLPRKAKTD